VNAVLPERFSGADAKAIEVAADGAGSPAAREALSRALASHQRAKGQRSQLARLRRGIDAPVSTLPFLLSPEVGREELEQLSHEIERKL
jgi:hypothetical protein